MIETDVLETVGKIAGIGGIAVGVFLILFRELIRKSIFPKLKRDDAYRLLKRIAVYVWSVALAALGAWVWVEIAASDSGRIETHGDKSPVVTGTDGDVQINIDDGASEEPKE